MKFLPASTLTPALCLAGSLLVLGGARYAERLAALADLDALGFVPEMASQSNLQPSSPGSSPDAINVFDSGASQTIQAVRYQEVVAATQAFLASLSDEQRAAVVLPFDSPYRTRGFCYVLDRCKPDNAGLRMSQLNAKQKIALNAVLMKGYSSAGYSRAIQTMNREGLIQELEDAHRANPEKYPVVGSPLTPDWSPPPTRDSGNYYIAIFGEPSAAAGSTTATPWGMRFEGHHLSLNLTFDGRGDQPRISSMPMFFGSSPMIVPGSPPPEEGDYTQWRNQQGQQMLNREAWLGRSFLQSLDATTVEKGAWSALPDVVLKGGTDEPLDAASYLNGEKPGIAVAELSLVQQQLVWDFVNEFAQMEASQEIDEAALQASIANARVWWYGDRNNEDGDLYVRVQSDRYLVELLQSNTFGVLSSDVESNHVHSSFRDLQSDWDRDSLGAHLSEHHASLTN